MVKFNKVDSETTIVLLDGVRVGTMVPGDSTAYEYDDDNGETYDLCARFTLSAEMEISEILDGELAY